MKYLVTFNSTAHAIKAESILLENNLTIKIRPLPNEISSGCGISIALDNIDMLKEIIASGDLKYDKIYFVDNDEYSEIN